MDSSNTEALKRRLSTLWIVVMFNMAFADIFSFMLPGSLEQIMSGSAGAIPVTPGFLVVAAVFVEIPILMIILSRVLPDRANRWANVVASVVTTLFVIGGGSASPHYIFFAAVEIVCMAVIVWSAWRWPSPERVA